MIIVNFGVFMAVIDKNKWPSFLPINSLEILFKDKKSLSLVPRSMPNYDFL